MVRFTNKLITDTWHPDTDVVWGALNMYGGVSYSGM